MRYWIGGLCIGIAVGMLATSLVARAGVNIDEHLHQKHRPEWIQVPAKDSNSSISCVVTHQGGIWCQQEQQP